MAILSSSFPTGLLSTRERDNKGEALLPPPPTVLSGCLHFPSRLSASMKTQFDLSMENFVVTQASWGLKFIFCPVYTSGGWRDGRARWGAPSHLPWHCRLPLILFIWCSAFSLRHAVEKGSHPYVPYAVGSQAPRRSMTVSCPWLTLFPVFLIPREAIWWSLPSQG